jgi:hypothetical protein
MRLKNDPKELKMVADQHSSVLKDLQAKLDEYLNAGKDLEHFPRKLGVSNRK